MKCHACGNDIKEQRPIGRQDLCPSCRAPLHCCLNCVFYAPGSYHDCRETEAEWVSDKYAPNFCDFFKPIAAAEEFKKKSEEAREKLDRLFKKT
jgi:hypothetical protein